MVETTSDGKAPEVPLGQQKPFVSPDESGEGPKHRPRREAVMENARKFLQEDKVRNAPTDKQIKFLESKGLQIHEIQELLGISRIQDTRDPELEPTADSTLLTAVTSSSPVPNSRPPRNVPPIITYPEFLITSPPPAPVVTSKRLLTTIYIFGGLSALLYGTSNYLIVPMVESLTACRHTFAEAARANLNKLIVKLKTAVSEVSPATSAKAPEYNDAGDEESDNDPIEMFHRDIGVQTSPLVSPSISRPSTPSSALGDQSARLSRLKTHLSSLTDASISEGQDTADLTIAMGLLRDYLNSLVYKPQANYAFAGGGNYGASQAGSGPRSGAMNDGQAMNDEIVNLKATIRSLKGVLLSARTFPVGASAAVGIGSVR